MEDNHSTPPAGIVFPCQFPIKVIGENTPDFPAQIIAILQRHVPDLLLETVSQRPSSGGKYLAVSADFVAESRAQLDALYTELTAHPLVRWVI